ncbi:hypothetical protein [Streptomyces sp. NBC_01264]|uniref:hypothetical protein n=1 Tax=Streptomyces sp. NBC_01264 TaxID=2903804 RepID=UPI00225396DB|nr:hypothetical protein [Streptomyces sp. NBC_01264]MCX4778138.1 hypothetical protein [Streptomyces sp. NBC_01264]
MTAAEPTVCPDCQHEQHAANTECVGSIQHGTSRWHRCLCLARPNANRTCPPLMNCQGGTLGYADLWYLQQGRNLTGTDGETITPDVLIDQPEGPVVPTLRDRAIDAVGQALNDANYWLPVEGRPVVVDAVLALVGACSCLDNPQVMVEIGYPIRCPHCPTTVPPANWTTHIQQHHPEQPEPLRPRAERCPESDCTDEQQCWRCDYEESQHASATFAAGYCPHCGRGDCAPTADEYVASQRRAVRIQQLLDDTRDRVRKIHQPALDSTWTVFGCNHDGGHSSPCAHCRSCYPCPTITALQPPKETPDA